MKDPRWKSAVMALAALTTTGLQATGQTVADFTQTAAYAAAHQNADGGFAASPGQPSTLGATNTGIRVLDYVGGSIPDVAACIAFVKSCKVPGSGFAQTPGGKPDVVTTAIGLLGRRGAEDRRQGDDRRRHRLFRRQFRDRSRKSGCRSRASRRSSAKSPDFPRWAEQIEAMRQPDGSFGAGSSKAFATGGRRGGHPAHGHAAREARGGHRRDQGWSAAGRGLVQG